jgi:hypothetical protein
MDSQQTERMIYGSIVLACFAVLSWLNGRYVGQGAGEVAAYTVLGLVIAGACLCGLAAVCLVAEPSLRTSGGLAAGWDMVARSYLLAIPFALLALLSELVFGWYAATAFMQAAIMTAGAAVGAELSRRAGPKLRYMIVCMAGAFAFSIIWIAYSAIFSRAAG